MGYWDHHPMAGDVPMDAECEIIDLLFTDDETDKYYNDLESADESDEDLVREIVAEREKEIAKRLSNNLELIADFLDNSERYEGFVLPFLMYRYDVRTSDKKLSDRIKNMIGDGGAKTRGYHENTKNSPEEYANVLVNGWDNYIAGGEIDIENMKSLFDVMNDKGDFNPRLINVK